MSKILQPAKIGKPALAGLLVCLVLFLSAVASSSALHKQIHPDADSPEHNCVITLFARGQIDAASATTTLTMIVAVFGGVLLLGETFTLASEDYRFSSSRAPPSLAVA